MVQPISKTTDIQGLTKLRPMKPTSVSTVGDAVHISPEAQAALRRQKDIQLARRVINETPDIREDKVKLARERLESGFYNQSDVVAAIAGQLIDIKF